MGHVFVKRSHERNFPAGKWWLLRRWFRTLPWRGTFFEMTGRAKRKTGVMTRECRNLRSNGQNRPLPTLSLGLRLFALAAASLSASCSEPPAALCQERTRRCLKLDSRDIAVGSQRRFEIELANICHEEIEYKLCFEVPGDEADCRQGLLASARRTEESIPLDRFGGKTRVYVRYSSEAKACRFPLTRDVEF